MPLPRYNTFRSTFKSRYLTITFKIQKSGARLSPTVVPKHFASGATTTTHIASKVAFFPLFCSSKQSMTHYGHFFHVTGLTVHSNIMKCYHDLLLFDVFLLVFFILGIFALRIKQLYVSLTSIY